MPKKKKAISTITGKAIKRPSVRKGTDIRTFSVKKTMKKIKKRRNK